MTAGAWIVVACAQVTRSSGTSMQAFAVPLPAPWVAVIDRRAREVLGRTIATTPDPENQLRGSNAIHRNAGLALGFVIARWAVVWLLRCHEDLGRAKVLCRCGLGSSAR